jgi:hypothetical protein
MEVFTITTDIGYNDDNNSIEWVNVAENCKGLDEREKKIFFDAIEQLEAEERYMSSADYYKKAKGAFSRACGWLSVYPWYLAVVEEFEKALKED